MVWRIGLLALFTAACGPEIAGRALPSRVEAASAQPAQRAEGPRRARVLKDSGGRVDWSPRGDLIAYDRRGADGFYDVYTANPDGTGERCLTCDRKELPNMHAGNPAWHPSGNYLVFQGQTRRQRLSAELAAPGKGVNNDLWVTDREGKTFRQLTDLGGRLIFGTLHPHFSHDGSKLVWAELLRMNQWALKVADVSTSGLPTIGSIKTFQPGSRPRFYESHGFTKDDRQIIFSSNSDRQAATGFDIYLMDLASGKATNLTNSPDDWDEHAQLSPDGRTILWASSRGATTSPLRLDLWAMNVDGADKRRVTNVHEASRPEYLGPDAVGPADSSWSPDGRRVIFYGIADQKEVAGRIVLIEL